jgi:potassium-transporting ATPase ATP-binding subunit
MTKTLTASTGSEGMKIYSEPPLPDKRRRSMPLVTSDTFWAAFKQSFVMLRPDIQWANPVMFVVEIGALLTLAFVINAALTKTATAVPLTYFTALDIWLFLTVLFANFATALAEARGKAQAESLRRTRRDTMAKRLRPGGGFDEVHSTDLKPGDKVLVEANDIIPSDGEIIDGIASINESAITGESAPVIREAGGDRSGVTGGTTVLSDQIIVRITSGSGETFLDRMIALVEGAIRQKSPNEIALTLALSALTLIFLIVVVPLWPMAWNAEQYMMSYLGISEPLKSLGTDVPTLVALLVCLIPTTIGALLAAIGIAGMERALRHNIISKSGKAVELAGDVDIVLLDKTGTITMGNRHATEFIPVGNHTAEELGRLAAYASAADQTPEGRSIVKCYEEKFKAEANVPRNTQFIAFTAQTRMSGIDLEDGKRIRKGASDAIIKLVQNQGGTVPANLQKTVDGIASNGATPLVVAEDNQVIGVVVLEDILKPAMKSRFERLRNMGLRTVMVTGDNPLTAAAIAKQAGVDDFLAQATPETKLAYLKQQQAEGKLVAMMGDGTNDAPALAQADVALAMNAGTQAAKEAANMVDLDSDPTKLIEVVEIGKQLLMTRGALTTFSIANDVAKYFAIIPAAFASTYPQLNALNIMGLHSSSSAILSAVIFNALIIIALIPLALRGVRYRPLGAEALLQRNLLIYGVGGLIAPFIGIKIIDLILVALHLA